MSESFSACGSFVQSPCGPRKSGIPDSVEIPAPVRITMRLASSTHLRMEAIDGSKEVISPGYFQHSVDVLGARSRARSGAGRGTATRRPKKPHPRPEGQEVREHGSHSEQQATEHLTGLQGPADVVEGKPIPDARITRPE